MSQTNPVIDFLKQWEDNASSAASTLNDNPTVYRPLYEDLRNNGFICNNSVTWQGRRLLENLKKDKFDRYTDNPKWAFVPLSAINKIVTVLLPYDTGSSYGSAVEQCDAIVSMPWETLNANYPTIDIDPEDILKELNKHLFGLDSIKLKVARYIFTESKRHSHKPLALLLYGSPGTGKTAFAKALAVSATRNLAIVNTNNLESGRDINGSPNVWIGSSCGIIAKSIIESKCFNPIILLDEIDKAASSDHHGRIHDALLSLLDSENKNFRDLFLDITFDCSQIIYVLTANTLDGIPKPFLDRVLPIELKAYSAEEIIKIVNNYIFPSLVNELSCDSIITDEVKNEICNQAITIAGRLGLRAIKRTLEDLLIDKLAIFDGFQVLVEPSEEPSFSYDLLEPFAAESKIAYNSHFVHCFHTMYFDHISTHDRLNLRCGYPKKCKRCNKCVDDHTLNFVVNSRGEKAIELLKSNIPEHLYRYRSGQNIDFLMSEIMGNLYVGSREEMNDPLDGHAVLVEEKLYDYYVKNERPELTDIATLFNQDGMFKKRSKGLGWYVGATHRLSEQFFGNWNGKGSWFRYACFSDSHINMPMWANYANNNRGVCFRYLTTGFDPKHFSRTMPVEYVKDVSSLFDSYKELQKVSKFSTNISEVVRDWLHIYERHFLQKLQDWEYEHEWRLLLWAGGGHEITKGDCTFEDGLIEFSKPIEMFLGVNASIDYYITAIKKCFEIGIRVSKLELHPTGLVLRRLLPDESEIGRLDIRDDTPFARDNLYPSSHSP